MIFIPTRFHIYINILNHATAVIIEYIHYHNNTIMA